MLLNPAPIRPGERLRWAQPADSADALALSRLARTSRPVLVVTANASDAQRLTEEIRFFAAGLRVHLFPDWETLPYDAFSPHQDLVSERLETLYHITRDECDVVVVPVATMLSRLPPTSYLAAHTFFLKKGDKLQAEQLRQQLTLAGYSHVSQVVSPGEYSVRGGVIDLFPMGSAVPYRIDLFDEEIDSLRTFDADTQRSIYKVNEVRLLPAREFPGDDAARTRFRTRFREAIEGDPTKSRVYKDISQGLTPAGIEYYLPLFFESTASLADYLPAQSVICLHGDIATAVRKFWEDTESRYRLLSGDADRPLLPPHELFLREDAFFGAIKPFARVEFGNTAEDEAVRSRSLPALAVDRKAHDPLSSFKAFHAS